VVVVPPVVVVVVVAVVVGVVVVVVVSVVVGGIDPPPDPGGEATEPSCDFRSKARSESVWCVRAALGLNLRTLFAPISLCATTVAICGAAQFGRLRAEPAAPAVQTEATAQTAASVARR
jgi:hypothetical protein